MLKTRRILKGDQRITGDRIIFIGTYSLSQKNKSYPSILIYLIGFFTSLQPRLLETKTKGSEHLTKSSRVNIGMRKGI